MGSLRRTQSFLVLPNFVDLTPSSSSQSSPQSITTTNGIPYNRSLRCYKEQRERRKALLNRAVDHPLTIRTRPLSSKTSDQPQGTVTFPQSDATPSTPPAASPPLSSPTRPKTPTPTTIGTPRTSSPLAPQRTGRSDRPVFPRSKTEPDVYRKAITNRMMCSPEGQKILTMGPRLAVSIMTATRELERIVAAQAERDRDINRCPDVSMVDATAATASLLMTRPPWLGGKEDWEMIDCGA